MEHPIETIRGLAQAVQKRESVWTDHFEEDTLPDRLNITKPLIRKYLDNFEALEDFEFAPDAYTGKKYNLLFDKSTTYWLKIVISFKNGTVAVITAHLANKTKKEKANLLKPKE